VELLINRPYSLKIFILVLQTILFSTHCLLAQIDWHHVTGQPVLDYGAPGSWESNELFEPAVINDGDTLRMWYTGCDTVRCQIGYAWSLDGIFWNRFSGNPVLTPGNAAWESKTVKTGTVIKSGDTLKMWYGATSLDDSLPPVVGYATSLDGIHWSKFPNPVIQAGPENDWDWSGISPETVIEENGQLKMWYTGYKDSQPKPGVLAIIQTGLATSVDGIHWIKYDDPSTTGPPYSSSDPVLKVGDSSEWDRQRAFGSCVLHTNNGFEMWYHGLHSVAVGQFVGYATSFDGVQWTKWSGNPILIWGPSWGSSYYVGTVLLFNDSYHFWNSSFNAMGGRARIGYAISPITSVKLTWNKFKYAENYSLNQNYPNPFNPDTEISFQLPEAKHVVVRIFNSSGQEIRSLLDAQHDAGYHTVRWDGRDDKGHPVSSGVYFYQLVAGDFLTTKKMSLLR
jgi:hypothetical protein